MLVYQRVPPVTAGITVSGWRWAPPHLHGIGHLLHPQRRCAGPGRRFFEKPWVKIKRKRLWLVGGWPTFLKNDGVRQLGWWIIPNWMESHKKIHGSSHHQSDEEAIGLSTDHWDLSMDFWGIPKKNPTIRPSVPSVAGTGFRTAGKPTSRERSESHQLWGVDWWV